MAGNAEEWTMEGYAVGDTTNNANMRGGNYTYISIVIGGDGTMPENYVAQRTTTGINKGSNSTTFRPCLYIKI